jgi:hypothetical protein
VPLGPEDPSLRLAKVVPHSAEFWTDDTDETIRYLFEGARTRAGADSAHGRANLSPSD